MSRYRNARLAELARQFAYTPRARRLEQLTRLRELAGVVQPDRTYPYAYICFQITRFRPDDPTHTVFDGVSLLADVVALIHDLSDSLDLPVSWAGEPVLSLDEVRRTYDVSLKTVRRWRAKGLVALRLVFADGRKLTGVCRSDLEAFTESHPEIIGRTHAYAYIDAETRRALLARAFELSLTEELAIEEATGRLAREFGCAHRSVRALLRRYDREHPEAPIFAQASPPLSDADRRQIMTLYRHGMAPRELAKAFLLGRSTVERVVRDLTVEDILDREWYYVPCGDFERPDAERAFLAEPLPADLDGRGVAGPLTPDQEQGLFRRYNFLKHQLAKARDELSPSELTAATIQHVVQLHDAAVATRNCIIVANLRLVVHLASRHLAHGRPLDELVSDGTVSLMQAVERFDFTRGVRFSTYASWAIRKNYAKTIPHEIRVRQTAMTGAQELIDEHPAPRQANAEQREVRSVIRSTVAALLLELSPREREVVVARFGLGQEPETLEQIGRRFEITRERVRQIEARALHKLADLVDPALIDSLL